MPLRLTDLMRESVADPRGVTRRITDMNLSTDLLWQALAVIIILTVLLEQIVFWLGGGGEIYVDPSTLSTREAQIQELARIYAENPFAMVAIQGGFAVVAIYAIYWVGRVCGGTGTFEDSLAMVVWFQAVLLGLQVAQAVVGLVLPPLSGFVALAVLALFFYLLTMFVAEIHGFQSPGMVFAMIVATMIAMAFVMTTLLTVFGVTFLPEIPNA